MTARLTVDPDVTAPAARRAPNVTAEARGEIGR